jgi:hypothetical protein
LVGKVPVMNSTIAVATFSGSSRSAGWAEGADRPRQPTGTDLDMILK